MDLPAPPYPAELIASVVAGELRGDGAVLIENVEELAQARPGDLTFIGSEKFAAQWPKCRASAALVSEPLADRVQPGPEQAVIVVPNADLALAEAMQRFAPPPAAHQTGVHPTAVVDDTATLGEAVSVGPHCYVGPGATLGDRCVLHHRATVMDQATLGEDCVLWPGSVVRERCRIGDRCILHSNAVIGADGFGYRPSADGRGMVKIPQHGWVELGHDVEVGANACIDRGKFAATTVGDFTKLDNLVQIGHNCKIGRAVVMSGQVGIAGSTTVGDQCVFAGQVGVGDHIHIGSRVRIAGGSGVHSDIPDGQDYGGYPAGPIREEMRKIAAVKKLPDLVKQLKQR